MRLGARQPKCRQSRRLLAPLKICTLSRRPRTAVSRKGLEIYPSSKSVAVIGNWSRRGRHDVAPPTITQRQPKCQIHTKTTAWKKTGVNRSPVQLAPLRIRWARVRRPRTPAPVPTQPQPMARPAGTTAPTTRRNRPRTTRITLMTEVLAAVVKTAPAKACTVEIRKHRRARGAVAALTAAGAHPACSSNAWCIRPTSGRLSPLAGKVSRRRVRMRRGPVPEPTSKFKRTANSTATCRTSTVTTVSTHRRQRRPTSMQTSSKGRIRRTEASSSHRRAKLTCSSSKCHHSSKYHPTIIRTEPIVNKKKHLNLPRPHSKRASRPRPPRNFSKRRWSSLHHSSRSSNALGVLEKNRSLRSTPSFLPRGPKCVAGRPWYLTWMRLSFIASFR